ncbi:MAG TPA: outer membrane beta-barrel protein [Acidobacteriaceae bacterium]|nr:outer membrane beta-barrel protein [Acidobacteriaceae bacterium]
MKKTMLLGVLMLSAAAGYAQESRQDVSFSGAGVFGPTIHSATGVVQSSTGALGLLLSYRYMLTPKSALELNYGFAQNNQKYALNSAIDNYRIHSRQQEFSAAYVYSLNFKRFSPFVEAGGGAMFFTPVLDAETRLINTKITKGIGGLFGGGLAYELSPSFDIRAEYRGFLVKAPSFGENNGSLDLNANRYEVISTPTIGVAYHF